MRLGRAFRVRSIRFKRIVRAKPEFAVLHEDHGEGNQQKNECDLQPARLRGRETSVRSGKLRFWIRS